VRAELADSSLNDKAAFQIAATLERSAVGDAITRLG
jgi:hypothetical protein